MPSSKSRSRPSLTPEQCESALKVCSCFHLRKASRLLTQFYDEMLQPTGLRSTQLILLMAIEAAERPTIASLAPRLGMDPSTLNRNLQPLKRDGLIVSQQATTGRRQPLSLTPQGRRKMNEAIPYWEKIQEGIGEKFGEKRWAKMLSTFQEFNAASWHE